MRTFVVLIVLSLSITSAQEPAVPKTVQLNFSTMAKGVVGKFSASGYATSIRCDQIINANEMVGVVEYYKNPRDRSSFRVHFAIPTEGFVDDKPFSDELDWGVWEVVGTKKIGVETLFSVKLVKKFTPEKITLIPIVLPIESPPLPKDDGRLLLIRQYSQAKKFRQDFAAIANSNKTPKDRASDYVDAAAKWATEANRLLKKIVAEKDAKIKTEKERIQAEAEHMFPVAVGAKLAERAKVDTKRTEYFKEKFPAILEKIQKEYSSD